MFFTSTIKKYLVYAIIIIVFILTGWISATKIKALRLETERLNNNIKNINFEYVVSKAKNGELIYSVNSLTVKGNELVMLNKNLTESVKNLNLKLKDLQSITSVQYQYITLYDTVFNATKLSKLKYNYVIEDKFSKFSGNINLPEKLFSSDTLIANDKKNYPYLSEVNFVITDTLLIAPEFKYKRVWLFWKRVNGVTVHIKAESPNFKLDRMQSFQIDK